MARPRAPAPRRPISRLPRSRVFLNASSDFIEVSDASLARNSIKWRQKKDVLEILVSGGVVPFTRMTLTVFFTTRIAKVEDERLIHRDLVGIFEEAVIGSDSAGVLDFKLTI